MDNIYEITINSNTLYVYLKNYFKIETASNEPTAVVEAILEWQKTGKQIEMISVELNRQGHVDLTPERIQHCEKLAQGVITTRAATKAHAAFRVWLQELPEDKNLGGCPVQEYLLSLGVPSPEVTVGHIDINCDHNKRGHEDSERIIVAGVDVWGNDIENILPYWLGDYEYALTQAQMEIFTAKEALKILEEVVKEYGYDEDLAKSPEAPRCPARAALGWIGG